MCLIGAIFFILFTELFLKVLKIYRQKTKFCKPVTLVIQNFEQCVYFEKLLLRR